MAKQYKTAVYIGRFQPVHDAHMKSIETALDIAETLLIFVGSSNKPRTVKNPFTTEQRIKLISNAIKEYYDEPIVEQWSDYPQDSILNRIKFISLRDYMYNDYKWASEVYSKALRNGATMTTETALMGCLKDDSSYYLKMFPNWDLNIEPYRWRLDATDIREVVYTQLDAPDDLRVPLCVRKFMQQWIVSPDSNDILDEYRYLKEYHEKWSVAPYPVTFTTVDSLVLCSGCVLLIKRGIELGKNQWALAGGFLNQNESIVDGALRELKEETEIKIPKRVLKDNIKDVQVFDHPKRSLRGRIVTHVHLIDLGYQSLPNVKGADDANEAHWIPIADALQMEDNFFEDHFDILVQMTSKY